MMSIISELWQRLTGRQEPVDESGFLIRYFHPWHLFCTPEGVYVRNNEYFEELRKRTLNASEISEYACLSINTKIVGRNRRQDDKDDERFSSLQRQVCLALLAEIEARSLAERAQYGMPLTLDRWAGYGENIPIGVEMLVRAVGHAWRGVAGIRRENRLLPAYVISGDDRQQLILPLVGINRVTIYPTRGVVSYKDGPTAHLDLLEPVWETWEATRQRP